MPIPIRKDRSLTFGKKGILIQVPKRAIISLESDLETSEQIAALNRDKYDEYFNKYSKSREDLTRTQAELSIAYARFQEYNNAYVAETFKTQSLTKEKQGLSTELSKMKKAKKNEVTKKLMKMSLASKLSKVSYDRSINSSYDYYDQFLQAKKQS